jgi:sterol desaturase/sphingolipid hydroxylase (fatty acid hydroxylase superfamily)
MIKILEYATIALIPAFILLDLVYSARRYNKPRFWRLRALAVTVVIFLITGEVAALMGKAFAGYSLLKLSSLGTVAGVVAGVLVYEFFHYWYHRMAHRWNWLWRAGHQMHHSAESLDAFGAYYGHPFDSSMFVVIASLVFFPLLGLSVEAGVISALFLTFNAMFQHANIKTPRWLGYIIQRPESHQIHHGRGIHKHNYSDLPLWDMIFGTFHNPTAQELENLECGFYKGASARIPEMLIGRSVHEPKQEAVISQPSSQGYEVSTPAAVEKDAA